jgi:predicted nucleic acid-binding Zn ribbon protein
VQRVFHPVAVHFKGSGFYTTDYRSRKRADEGEGSKDEGSAKSKDPGSESKAEKKPATAAE